MTVIRNFNDPFKGEVAFFTGTGSNQSVPYAFPVAINGRPYMVDTKAGTFARQFDTRVRDSVDQSAEPGESAINPQGLWRRSQSSWHYGAGQVYSDTADAEPYRFRSSKGLNVWDRGKLSLLPATTQAYSSAQSNLDMTTASNRIYFTEGQTVRYTTDWSTFTTVTNTNASNLYSITSDGYNVFFSYADGNIDQTDSGSSAASNYITGIEAGILDYVRGRLMVAGKGAEKHKIWNIRTAPGSSENNPSALFSHANTDFEWVGFAGGQNQIYCAGHAGNKSMIYKTAVKADGTALDIPTVAAELPLGEIVTTIDAYLGFVIIGLTTGLRFCSSDSDGNLVVGPLIETGTSVSAFAAIGPYLYFGWTNYDATSTGIGRLDIGTQISANQPAYASDLMADVQGEVVDIHEFGGGVVFTVAGHGAYRPHPTNKVASGYLNSGIYRWGVPDAKFIPKWDLRTEPLNGTVNFEVSLNDGSFLTVGIDSIQGSSESTFDGLEDKVFEAEAKITMIRSGTDSTKGPVLTRWMARAYAAPLRSQIFSVPLLLHHKLNVRGNEYWIDVDKELALLRDLVESPRVVTYQENFETYPVIVEDVRWEPVDSASNHNSWDWNGTCTLIMRSVR